ncbi:MAG: hypothetical protein QM796_14985 [Chthoniobacteraceae bacterium]
MNGNGSQMMVGKIALQGSRKEGVSKNIKWLAATVLLAGISAHAATVEQLLPQGVTIKTASDAQLREAAKQSAATDASSTTANITEALKQRHDLASTKALTAGAIEGIHLRYASATPGLNSDGKSIADGKDGKDMAASECPEIQSLVGSVIRTTPQYNQQVLDLALNMAPDCVMPAVAEGYSDSGVLERHFDFSLLDPPNKSNTVSPPTVTENPNKPVSESE